MLTSPSIYLTQQGILAVLRREFPAGAQRQDLLDFVVYHLLSPEAHQGHKGRMARQLNVVLKDRVARQLNVILGDLYANAQVVSEDGVVFAVDQDLSLPTGSQEAEGVPTLERSLHKKLYIALRAEDSGSVQKQQEAQCHFLHAAAEAGWSLNRGMAALGLSNLGAELLIGACPSLHCLVPEPIPPRHAIKEFQPKKQKKGHDWAPERQVAVGDPGHHVGGTGVVSQTPDLPPLGRLLHKKLFLALLAVDRGSTGRQQEAQCDFLQEALAAGWTLDQGVAALGLPQRAADHLAEACPSLREPVIPPPVLPAAELGMRAVSELKKKRGRPRKVKPVEPEEVVVPKKRGRPRKIRPDEETSPKKPGKKRAAWNWRKERNEQVVGRDSLPRVLDALTGEPQQRVTRRAANKHPQSLATVRSPVHQMLDGLVRDLRLDGVPERTLSYALLRERMHSLRRTGMSIIEARWRIRQELDGYEIPNRN